MRRPKGRIERIIAKAAAWFVVLLLLGIAVFLAGSTWEVRQKERAAWQEREYAREAYEEAVARRDTLLEYLSGLSTDRGVEEEFRKRFPVARDGEEIIILVDPSEATLDTVPEPSVSFWQRIKGWFSF